jgi:hypothetical protein
LLRNYDAATPIQVPNKSARPRPGRETDAGHDVRRFLADPAANGEDLRKPFITRVLTNRSAVKTVASRHGATNLRPLDPSPAARRAVKAISISW